MTVASPHTREEIIAAFHQQETESTAYWSAFDTQTFFQKMGSSWSPAETVRHLIKSTRPVVKALGMPGLVLRILFGKPQRPSQTYEELCARYANALAEGGQAGRFAPSPKSEEDLQAWRSSILGQFASVHRELRGMISRWPESKLDRLQLPHPLLGKLTIREMLFFTLYHQKHHIAVVDRRARETQR